MNDKNKKWIFNEVKNSYQETTINPPYGNNSYSKLSILFEDREYYSDYIIPFINKKVGGIKLFADLTKENSLYGLIDTNLNAIYAKKEFTKEIQSADEESKYVLNFVADAFNDLNQYLLQAALLGKISKKSVFYKLKSYKSFIDPEKIFFTNQTLNIQKFIDKTFQQNNFSSNIKNINDFNKHFLEHLKNLVFNFSSINKASVLYNSYFFGFTSGLVIDIAKQNAGDDKAKYEKFFLDDGFPIFADACKRFGFLIDKNIPWRLVADLSSPAMNAKIGNHIGYMTKYNLNSLDDLYSKYFVKCYTEEIDYLKQMFFSAYNILLQENPNYELDYKTLQICDFNRQTIFSRETINIDKFNETFPDSYWIRVLVFLKNYEEKRNFNQQQFENVVREANNFVKAGRTQDALSFVNDYFKQFKNVQYFSSLQKNDKKLKEIADNTPAPNIVF